MPTPPIPVPRRRRLWPWLAGAAVLVVAAGATIYGVRHRPLEVPAHHGPIVEAVYGLGTVESERVYVLKLGITATLTEVYADEGDAVAAGAPLVRLDSGVVMRAPFEGTVTRRDYEPRETVTPGAPILALQDLTDRTIRISLDQDSALLVRPGMAAEVAVESLRGRTFDGTVASVYPSDGEFIVTVDVPGLDPAILPGMSADVAIEVARREDALLVPLKAVNNATVRRIRDGERDKVRVVLGAINGEYAEVVSGDIAAGDTVLVPRR